MQKSWRQKLRRQEELCPDCGYVLGLNHEGWCPTLHPDEWSWLLRAKQGPASQEAFYEGTVPNQDSLAGTFRIWIAQEQEWKHIGTGTFRPEIFHLFKGRSMHYSEYTVSFARGCELWGNAKAQVAVIKTLQQVGGGYRTY